MRSTHKTVMQVCQKDKALCVKNELASMEGSVALQAFQGMKLL
jgi:hypothetical protein